MSWWSDLFGGKKTEAVPASALRAPTYKDLVDRVSALEDQLADERKATAERRIKVASRAQDDQALLERYRLALEYYADTASWRKRLYNGDLNWIPAVSDAGYKARKALGRTP